MPNLARLRADHTHRYDYDMLMQWRHNHLSHINTACLEFDQMTAEIDVTSSLDRIADHQQATLPTVRVNSPLTRLHYPVHTYT